MRVLYFFAIISVVLYAGCSGGYKDESGDGYRTALVYLGDAAGNRVIYFNKNAYPHLDIYRKTATDSAFVKIKTLDAPEESLTRRVGDYGPGYAYNWTDSANNSQDTEYMLVILNHAYEVVAELGINYFIPDGHGDWNKRPYRR